MIDVNAYFKLLECMEKVQGLAARGLFVEEDRKIHIENCKALINEVLNTPLISEPKSAKSKKE